MRFFLFLSLLIIFLISNTRGNTFYNQVQPIDIGKLAKQDIWGYTSNGEGETEVQAQAWALGTAEQNNDIDLTGFRSPTIVAKLADHVPPLTQGSTIQTDEIPTKQVYYDASIHRIDQQPFDCHSVPNFQKCSDQPWCGWCGAINKCVKGNALSALEFCPGGYMFSTEYSILKVGMPG